MSPLASYRRLLHLAGPAYVVVAFLGRLPLAMSQLGTLLLVSTATGSFGTGGLAAGALAVANAVGSPVGGALADRVGQRRVVLVSSLLGATGLVALVVSVHAGLPVAAVVATAAATGLVLPQVGPLARVRWRPIITRTGTHTGTQQRRLVDAAFSYEGAADEASFALGPAAVGVVAVLLSPAGALLGAAALLAVFGSAFALHDTGRRTRPASRRTTTPVAVSVAPLVTAAFVVLLAAQVCIGMLFGATQTGVTVVATDAGRPGLAGLVHATLAVGSTLAGIATAYLPERVGHERRALVAAGALVVLSLPLLVVSSLAGTAAVVAVLGVAVAPYMIAVFSLGERIVPQARVGTAMTLLASATGIGYAVGSTAAGRAADAHGAHAAFAVTVVATVLALVLLTDRRASLARAVAHAHAQPDPDGGVRLHPRIAQHPPRGDELVDEERDPTHHAHVVDEPQRPEHGLGQHVDRRGEVDQRADHRHHPARRHLVAPHHVAGDADADDHERPDHHQEGDEQVGEVHGRQ